MTWHLYFSWARSVHSAIFLETSINVVLLSTLSSSQLPLPLYSPKKSCMYFSFPTHVLHASHILFFLFWSPEEVRNGDSCGSRKNWPWVNLGHHNVKWLVQLWAGSRTLVIIVGIRLGIEAVVSWALILVCNIICGVWCPSVSNDYRTFCLQWCQDRGFVCEHCTHRCLDPWELTTNIILLRKGR